jgi:hypothetical protein
MDLRLYMLEVDYTSVCQDPLYARSPEFTIADWSRRE